METENLQNQCSQGLKQWSLWGFDCQVTVWKLVCCNNHRLFLFIGESFACRTLGINVPLKKPVLIACCPHSCSYNLQLWPLWNPFSFVKTFEELTDFTKYTTRMQFWDGLSHICTHEMAVKATAAAAASAPRIETQKSLMHFWPFPIGFCLSKFGIWCKVN